MKWMIELKFYIKIKDTSDVVKASNVVMNNPYKFYLPDCTSKKDEIFQR